MLEDEKLTIQGDYIGDLEARSRDARLNRLVARHGEVMGKARDYTNIIIVAGYVAFFTLWAGIADDLDVLVRCLTAGLLGLSLVVFVGWEIAGMVIRVIAERPFGELDPTDHYPGDFEERWDRAMAVSIRMQRQYITAWPWVLGVSAGPGLAGGALLAGAAFARVLV